MQWDSRGALLGPVNASTTASANCPPPSPSPPPPATALSTIMIPQLVKADFDDPVSLREAFKGCDAVFGVTDFWVACGGDGDRELQQGGWAAGAARRPRLTGAGALSSLPVACCSSSCCCCCCWWPGFAASPPPPMHEP